MKQLFPILLLLFASFACKQKTADYLIAFTDSNTQLAGFKNTDGKIVIPAKYFLTTTDTLHVMAFVVSAESEWIAIDRNENILLKPFIFDNGPDYVREGLFRFVDNGKMGFANLNAEKVIPAQFDFVTPFENGIAEYTLGGHKEYDISGEHWFWVGGYENGYVNKTGQRFKQVDEPENGIRNALTTDNKQVKLNNNGQIVN